jgi:altronate dehydratase small subunit
MIKALMINDRDNTATLFDDARSGDSVTVVRETGEAVEEIVARQAIPVGHKIAIGEIKEGAEVVKYGETIGIASHAIQKGDHVHVRNVVGVTFPGRPIPSRRRTL